MIRLLVFLVIAAGLAYAFVWLADMPGQVVVDWGTWHIEAGLVQLVLAAIAIAVLAIIVFEILRWLAVLPRRVRRHRNHRRELRGYRALSGGLVAAAAGDLRTARAMGRSASRLLKNDEAVLMLEAQRAQLEGDDDKAQLRFRQMLRRPETELLGVRGLLAQSIKEKDREEAIALARRAYRISPSTPWTVTTLFELLTQQEAWGEALPVLERMKELQLHDEETLKRHRVALEVLHGRRLLAEGKAHEAHREARHAFRLMPSFAPAAVLAAETAKELGRQGEGRRTLERAWQVAPHPDTARAYAELEPSETAADRLKRFARLQRRSPTHYETCLTMAELSIAAGDLERGRSLIEQAISLPATTARAYRLMAELERTAGSSPEIVKEWHHKAENASPDMAWVCRDTGQTFPSWVPFGANGRFNGVVWDVPPRLALLTAPPPQPTFVLTHGRAEAPRSPADEPRQALESSRKDGDVEKSEAQPAAAA